MEIMKTLGQLGVIPVVKIERAGQAPALAEALCRGGLPCVEIAFRTDAAEEAIRLIGAAQPEMLVGAGTVLSVAQAQKAVDAGARFIVSPGFDPKVVDWCLKQEVAVIPGIATSTEALMALDKGLRVLKFFPAEELGGIPMLQAISAALIGVKFLPTGGITPANMPTYLRLPMVFAVAGSWLAAAKMIAAGDFEEIKRLAGEAVVAVHHVRQTGEKV
jgi:2-dehydro-3-deoxyphosphogluconate aldolase/(4S)-4-hydroxy-2-oxoglutarate aldolase